MSIIDRDLFYSNAICILETIKEDLNDAKRTKELDSAIDLINEKWDEEIKCKL